MARRVPHRQVPDWLIRVGSLFSPFLRQSLPELGKVKHVTGEKARQLLGWAPRTSEEAIVASAESLRRWQLLKDSH